MEIMENRKKKKERKKLKWNPPLKEGNRRD